MTIAFWCVLAAALMPYLWVGIAKFSVRGYDNAAVRDFEDRLNGMPKRAHWAHLNSFEAFPFFAAGVIIATIGGADAARIDLLAMSFVGLRLAYGAAYLANQATLRSLIWLASMVTVVLMFTSIPAKGG